MEYGSSIISFMFFLAFSIYLFWGIYILKINPKQGINKAFFALSISMCIWSLGYSMTNAALDLQTALFWRRVAAIGKVFLFSTFLHFMLLLANKDISAKQKKLFLFIHIPAFVNMYIFSLSNNMAAIQYNMVKNNYGWINIPANNLWDFLYYFYYATYILSSLIIVWKWKKKFQTKSIIKQSNFFFVTFVGALSLGTFTDIIVSSISKNPLPQITPLFVLLPVWSMYYAARHYDVLKVKVTKEETIISSDQQQKIFTYLSIAICISAILAFVSEYFSEVSDGSGDLRTSSIKGGLLLILGFSLFFIQKIKKKSLKEMLTTVILISSIPIVTFQFLNYSTITVWVFPILIIISSLLFNKRTLLISATIVAIITQRLVWILRPESYVLVDRYDFILRIIVFIVVFLISSYINKIYIAKIKENDLQIKFQKMNAMISSDFISMNKENRDEKIEMLLSKIGSFFQADRTYLFLIDHVDNTMTYSHEWCNEGIKAEVETIKNIPLTVFPWWINQLSVNKLVLIEDVNNMPKEAINEQEQLFRQNVKTLVSVPVEGKERIKGFIGVDSVESYRTWTEQDIKLLNILSNLLSDGLTRLKSEKEIEFMAYYDRLTKFPNRFLFKERVVSAINLAKRANSSINIIFIDLDNFKSVNDTLGHDGGDYLLREVANNLVKSVRKTDTVARFGGDEFMIVLNDIQNQRDVYNIADALMDIFSKPFNIYGEEFCVTASAGISTYPIDGEDPETLIKNADTAMYEAKAKGKNGYEFCTMEMKYEVEKNMTMSNDLYYALERDELSVYYQPQMDLNNKKIVGLEALLRWKHPKLGMIPPKVFIPIAEKNGLINSIGQWVLKTACSQNRKWQDMELIKLRMAVNLSGIQFINANIAEDVSNILKDTGLDAKYLELEITESIAIKETEFVVNVLNKLKKVGVSIAIDDFGTEYSSLSRLKLLPIDRIKIDMEFIHGIENNDKDKAVTAIIINLAKSLGLNVLAEGVETAPQLEFLNQKMCDYVQGFYYYKPMPSEEMEKVLKTFSITSNKLI